MNEPEHLDVLQNIEFIVVRTWRDHPELNNYNVMRAYEAAIAHYGALARGLRPKPVELSGLDEELFLGIIGVSEWRLGNEQNDKDKLPPIPLEDLVGCLRKLRKSVERWTREGGRQGYLEFIKQFLP
jgi:hypothetical protein